MKPDWDKLMTAFEGHASTLIADVDCTADGKDLCNEVGVRGYPTIKYGDPNDLQDYKGGRSLKDLQKFASENLGPTCGPNNLDLCDDAKKKQIEELQALDPAELDKRIKDEEQKGKDAEKKFEEEVDKLQKRYKELSTEKEETLEAIKASGLGMMKAVKAAAKKKAEL